MGKDSLALLRAAGRLWPLKDPNQIGRLFFIGRRQFDHALMPSAVALDCLHGPDKFALRPVR